ncbi:hypothetical protein HMPREF6485_1100 [Segatella buccae ATCC 33574]|uniref:Uncharacterized protein n=1 Tax=Segatella buccae ATCC 33574 TaxID=873513 RepID=E6K652_9BACT|nr:hypothetical protein HMPREF6485_1100 [Segatella buccae ATCC 33574]
MGLQKGHFRILIRPLSASDYGLFTKSFGLSEKLDRPNGENKANGIGRADELGENPCNAFSKSLIVRAIERPLPPLKRRGVPRGT